MPPPPNLSTIEEHAEGIDEKQPSLEAQLISLQAQVEFLSEESGLENKFRTELSEYVKDLREEAEFIKTARKIFGAVAIVAAAGLLITPVVLAYTTSAVFKELPDYPKSALLIAMIAGGVLLIQAIAKSVYRSAHERQTDEFIPPQIKLLHELTKSKEG